ncbi:MAG: hypothetical protein CMN28_08895 [Salinisphaeraceae bacterium]|nr:hypothetical protein [Salinisphaeraceae bacterium]
MFDWTQMTQRFQGAISRWFPARSTPATIQVGRCRVATSDPREARQVAILASCAFDKQGIFEVNGHRVRWWSSPD